MAVAINARRTWRTTGWGTDQAAITAALEGCQAYYGEPCTLAAVGNKVEPGSKVTPYKLRHLFANVGLRASGDPAASSRILLHGVQATSAIYREEAEDEKDDAAWAAIDAWHRAQGRKLTYAPIVLDGGIRRKGLRRVK